MGRSEIGAWRPRRLVLPDSRLVVAGDDPPLPVADVQRFVYEPDGAVIRAGGIALLGRALDAALLAPGIAYLTASRLSPTPYAAAFEVLQALPLREKTLRTWVREHRVGALEIKQRGLAGDPAELRRRLRPDGPHAATLILTRTVAGSRALVVERR